MTGNLENSLRAMLRPAAINAAAGMLRESVSSIVKGYDASVAVMLEGVAASLADPVRRSAVAGLIARSGVVCAVDDVCNLLKPGVTPPAVAAGNHLLELVFGERVGPVANRIGGSTAIKSSSAYIMLSLAATLVAGTLSQRLGHERITIARLSRLLDNRGTSTGGGAAGGIGSRLGGLAALRRPSVGSGQRAGTAAVRDRSGHASASSGTARALALWLLMCTSVGVLTWVLVDLAGSRPQITASTEANTATQLMITATVRGVQALGLVLATAPAPGDTAPVEKAEHKPASEAARSATASVGTDIEAPAPQAGRDPARSRPVASREVPVPAEDIVPALAVIPSEMPLPGLVASGAASVEDQLIGYLEDKSPPDRSKWFDMDGFKFKPGSASLSEDSKNQLELMAEILKAFPQAGMTIGGYTDSMGEPTANRSLSEARAKAVVASLVKRGVPPERLKASGFGDQRPIADNATAHGRARNRRIAVSVTAK